MCICIHPTRLIVYSTSLLIVYIYTIYTYIEGERDTYIYIYIYICINIYMCVHRDQQQSPRKQHGRLTHT